MRGRRFSAIVPGQGIWGEKIDVRGEQRPRRCRRRPPPDAIESSQAALRQEENERLLTNFYLVNSVIDRLSQTRAKLTVAELSSPEGQRKVVHNAASDGDQVQAGVIGRVGHCG